MLLQGTLPTWPSFEQQAASAESIFLKPQQQLMAMARYICFSDLLVSFQGVEVWLSLYLKKEVF